MDGLVEIGIWLTLSWPVEFSASMCEQHADENTGRRSDFFKLETFNDVLVFSLWLDAKQGKKTIA